MLRGEGYIPNDAGVVTKSDTVANIWKAFRSPSAGDVKVTTVNGTALVIPCLEGELIVLAVKLIWSTGTTVTGNIIGFK